MHVRAYGMQAARDEQIVDRAAQEDRIIVSADSDFSAILAAHEAERPSFILFREPDLMLAMDYFHELPPLCQCLNRNLLPGASPFSGEAGSVCDDCRSLDESG